MTLVDGSSGFSPAFMWCGAADIPGMPSSTVRDEWGAVTYFLGSVDRRMSVLDWDISVGATSISGGHRMVCRKIGNPCAEKVLQHSSQIIFL